MVFYNLAVAGVLASAGFGDGLHGMLLWPAAAFHVAMGAWCVRYYLEARLCHEPHTMHAMLNRIGD